MSKKRGLSLEEKRTKMLEIFYDKKDFFLLKELEKIAPKEKGIISQSVKDVLQSLVDDNLVDSEKIGTSIYFWAFPSKAAASRKRKLDELQEKVQEVSKRIKTADKQCAKARQGKEDSEERSTMLQQMSQLQSRTEELKQQLKQYKDCDPELVEQMKSETVGAVHATNRWTDNIFAMHSWITKKFPSIKVSDLNKQFGIPDDLDYV